MDKEKLFKDLKTLLLELTASPGYTYDAVVRSIVERLAVKDGDIIILPIDTEENKL